MTRTITFVLALSVSAIGAVAACGGHEQPSSVTAADDASAPDRDSGLPPGVDHYHGNVACCAQDAGLCCSDEVQQCEAYVACVPAGEAWEPKGLYCQECCPGLEPLEVILQNDDGTCTPSGNGFEPSFLCGVCGNGVCEKTSGENHCSCPADCP